MYKTGIFIFDEVEVLDFAGPFEVFSLAEFPDRRKVFNVQTIAENKRTISARNGLKVIPDLDLEEALKINFDVLIIPGGYGAEEIEIKKPHIINWIKEMHGRTNILASVCTGAFLLAEAGLLDNIRATTHWLDLDRLEKEYEKISVIRNKKFIDNGKIITAAGISAGINMSYHIVERMAGKEIADATVRRMEYDIVK
jgi:transcriptional regulator GlxA family with amidase domain